MSFHHEMMLRRYGLAHTTTLYSQALFDPIFTPLFTAILGGAGAFEIIGGVTVAQAAAAIATTGITQGVQIR